MLQGFATNGLSHKASLALQVLHGKEDTSRPTRMQEDRAFKHHLGL